MATSGTLNTSLYKDADGTRWNRRLTFSWSRKSYSTTNNTSTISWTLKGTEGDSSSFVYLHGYSLSINGSVVSSKPNSSQTKIELHGAGATTVASGTTTIAHNNDGTKSFSVSISGAIYTVATNVTGSGTFTLDTIPRYASITQFDLGVSNETQLYFNWGANKSCDTVQYSLNGGAWQSGSYPTTYISGLSANTSYNVKIRVQASDSKLWTESSVKSATTYDYPKPLSANNFTIGNGASVNVYNPLGRTYTLQLIGNGGNVIGTYTGAYNGVVNAEFTTNDAINKQYQSIPNSKSGAYYAKVTYGNVVKTTGNYTYSCNDNACTPSIDSSKFSYKDSNSTIVGITGNNQHIVQSQSNLVISRESGYASARNYASISKCEITFNGVTKTSESCDFGSINLSANANYTIKVTDSRGYSNSTSKSVTILSWSLPTISVNASRLNNYEDEVTVKVTSSISSVNGKNSIRRIRCFYKESSESSYVTEFDLSNDVAKKINLDKNKVWNFKLYVADVFATTSPYYFIVGKGQPVWFVDTKKLSVGVNCFPKQDNSFEVNGKRVALTDEVIDESTVVTKDVGVTAHMTSKDGYLGFDSANGNYLRTPSNGLLPNTTTSGGYVGTSSWKFSNGYFKDFNVTDNLSVKLLKPQYIECMAGNEIVYNSVTDSMFFNYRAGSNGVKVNSYNFCNSEGAIKGNISCGSVNVIDGFRMHYTSYPFIDCRWNDGNTHDILSLSNDRTNVYIGPGNYSGNGEQVTNLRGYKLNMYTHGGAITTNRSITVSSDRNVKEDIKLLNNDDRWDKFFSELKPTSFKYIDNHFGRNHIGYIAQDVEQALKDSEISDREFGGLVVDNKYIEPEVEGAKPITRYSLRYSEFIALNTHMIQKQQKQIELLEKRIEELEKLLKEK